MKVKLTMGERLQDRMNELNMSINELDSITKLGKTTISRLLNDKGNPTAKTIRTISQALNVSSDYILGLQDDFTTNLDLLSISNDYGISSKAMNKLKTLYSFTKETDWNSESIKEAIERQGYEQTLNRVNLLKKRYNDVFDALNTILESKHLDMMLREFSNYINFFPSERNSTMMATINNNFYESLNNGNSKRELTINDFDNQVMLTSITFNNYLLDNVVNYFKKIKENSDIYKEQLKIEIDLYKDELKQLEIIYKEIDKNEYMTLYIKNLKSKIENMEFKLESEI